MATRRGTFCGRAAGTTRAGRGGLEEGAAGRGEAMGEVFYIDNQPPAIARGRRSAGGLRPGSCPGRCADLDRDWGGEANARRATGHTSAAKHMCVHRRAAAALGAAHFGALWCTLSKSLGGQAQAGVCARGQHMQHDNNNNTTRPCTAAWCGPSGT
jgi:hypothetical protein